MMTMTETAEAAAVLEAAAMTDTGHAALLMSAGADDPRVLEILVGECTEEEEAGVARMTDTGKGLEENPGEGLDRAPGPQLRETTPTHPQHPTILRRKCDEHTPHPAPGPGLHQGHVLAHGPAPGLDASQEDARKSLLPF